LQTSSHLIRSFLALAFVAISYTLTTASHAALVLAPVDDFTDASEPAPEWNRTIDLRITANPWNQSASIRVSSVGSGYLVVGNGAGVISETSVEYSASSGPVDLTANGADGLSIGLGLADVPGDFTTIIRDSNGNFATSTVSTTESIRSFTELEFLFADFQNPNGVDLANITTVSLTYLPSRDGADLLIDYVATSQIEPAAVPEPSVLSLIFICVAASTWRRRRSPRQSASNH